MRNSGDADMADEAGRSRLGRGLAALMADVGEETKALEQGRNQRRVPIERLRPNPRNPRRNYAETELDELAASMRERGIIQPIVVRPVHGAADSYEIIAGERRWRTARPARPPGGSIRPVAVSRHPRVPLPLSRMHPPPRRAPSEGRRRLPA